MNRRHFLVAALAIAAVLTSLSSPSRAAPATERCEKVGGVSCFTLSDLKGQTLWTLTGLKEADFRAAIVAGTQQDRDAIRAYLPRVNGPTRYGPPERPTIFVYITGGGTGPLGSYWWPMTPTGVDGLLRQHPGVLLVGDAGRVLFAARDATIMKQLISAALGGIAPSALPAPQSEQQAAVNPIPCTVAGAPPCYTPATLAGKTLWEITGLNPARESRLLAVAANHLSLQLVPTPGIWRPSNRWLRGPYVSQQLAGRPVIFTYVSGEDVSGVSPSWPVSQSVADGLLAAEPAIIVWNRAQGQPRVLLAARDWASLDRLVGCAVKGVCPSLYADAVAPWNKVVPDVPKWADASVVVDLRSPADNGTAVVYLSVPGYPDALCNLGGSLWRPTALRAIFRPEDGARTAVMPDDRVAPRTDARGRLVYEVNPYYEGSLTGSEIYHDLAFIWMEQLLAPYYMSSEQQVAIKWLLPDGWSLNAPWAEADGWYRANAGEIRNTYVGLGKLTYSRFDVQGVRYTLAQLADAPSAERDAVAAYTKAALERLGERLGPPPTPYNKDFAITVYNRWVEGGGAGYRTVQTSTDRKILIHELIHLWLGVPYRTDQTWSECVTEYLAARSMLDFGIWTQAQYDEFMRSQQSFKASYGPASKAENVYSGDALAFARDLDAYIRQGSGGKHTLYDAIRYAATGKAQQTVPEIQTLIKAATGVDSAPFFAQRW